MKTTTIIMFAISLAFLLLVEGAIIYSCSQMKPYEDFYREASDNYVTTPLEKFSSVDFIFDERTYLSSSEHGAFLVMQSDSVEAPSIEMPDNYADLVNIAYSGEKLEVSIKLPVPNEDLSYGRVIVLPRPIVIRTPVMPDTINNSYGNGITVMGRSEKNLALISQGTVKFSDARLSTVTLTNEGISRDVDPRGPIFVNSELDEIITDNYKVDIYIRSDSLSSVKKFTVNGIVDYNQIFNPGNLRIDSFTFEPADSASSITLTDYSKISLPFNNN